MEQIKRFTDGKNRIFWYCPNCGSVNPEDSKECWSCNYKAVTNAEYQTEPVNSRRCKIALSDEYGSFVFEMPKDVYDNKKEREKAVAEILKLRKRNSDDLSLVRLRLISIVILSLFVPVMYVLILVAYGGLK